MEMSAQFMVSVPEGVEEGQLMQATSPDGQTLQFPVPAGVAPGMAFPVAYAPRPPQQAMAVPLAAPVAMPMATAGAVCAPGQYQIRYSGSDDPWAVLSRLETVKIKEKVQLMEVLVGWEMPNKYMLSDPLSGRDLFVAAEKQDGVLGAVGRQLFEGEARPFSLDIALLTGEGQPPQPFVHMERPFKCTCCCFQRPEVFVTNANTNQLIGSLIDPFACCNMTFDIKDASGEPRLEINHGCCDCSLICWGCPCGCQEVDFQVKDKDSGETVGHIRKKFRMTEAIGMVTGVGVDADQYEVEFGGITQPEYKALLLSTALFLDFRFFTKGGQTQREESVLGRVAQQNEGVAGFMGPLAGLYGAND